jgi:sigma-B regulation protein RsbU (phosphoserine phosphatase)
MTEAHAYSKPARTFTGDFYLTHRDDDRLWFVLGDVAGKGLPAAIFMAMIQEELEQRIASCAAAQCDPSITLKRLHEFLQPLMPQNRFATIVIGTLHDDGTLTIANAGHCPPLIVRDGVVEQIDSTGPVAGLLRQSRWHSVTRELRAGDAILLYSDGVLEAQNRDGEEFGVDRIMRSLIRAECGRSIIDAVLADAADYKFDDDVTLLAITAS